MGKVKYQTDLLKRWELQMQALICAKIILYCKERSFVYIYILLTFEMTFSFVILVTFEIAQHEARQKGTFEPEHSNAFICRFT